MIKGIVCRNLERRSGKMAAGCANVNGIAAKGSQISPATCKFCLGEPALRRVGRPGGRPTVGATAPYFTRALCFFR